MLRIKRILHGVNPARGCLRRGVSLGAATLLLTSVFVISIDGIAGVRIAFASTQAGMRDTTFPSSLPSWITRGVAIASNGEIFVPRNTGFVKYSPTGAMTTIASSSAFDSVVIQNIGGTEYVIVGGTVSSPTARLVRYTLAGVRDTTFNAGQANTHRALNVSVSTNKIFAGVDSSNALVRYSENGVSEASVTPGGVINAVRTYTDGGTEYVLVGGAFGMKRYVAGTLVDSGFAANPGATVNAIEVQPDGKILVGGTFGLRRYLATGEVDSGFASVSGTVTAVTVQSDGKILAGIGNLRRYSSTGVPETVFNNNAALDSDFGVARNSIAIQSDGRIVVGGDANPAHRYLRRYSAVYVAPSTPPAPTAVAADMQATVSVTAGSGAVPTSYLVTTVEDPSKTCTVTGASGSCVMTGLTNGVTYTFTSTAFNGDVPSSASSPASNAITPFPIPPVISSAVLGASGTILTLTYNETIAATTALPSNFTVTVNGSAVGVTGVSATGGNANVVLTLDTVVAALRTVLVSYAPPAPDAGLENPAIQDIGGADAIAFTNRSVTNSSAVDQTPPTLSSTAVTSTGTSVTLTFNETLRATTASPTDFTVLNNGVPIEVIAVASTGANSVVTLTLATPIGKSLPVSVSYAAPSADTSTTNSAIQDNAGNDAISFTTTTVSNSSNVDQTPPVFSSAALAANGTTLTLSYNETLRATTAPVSAYTVLINGEPATISSATSPGNTATVILTLASVVAQGRTISVSYDAPTPDLSISNNAIQDNAGNDAISLSARAVTNNSSLDQTPPTLSSASVATNGTTITLRFNETLRSTTAFPSDFTVLNNGVPVTVTAVTSTGSNSDVTLTLASPIGRLLPVSVAYNAPTPNTATTNNAIQDNAGNDAASFTTTSVTNSSSVDQTPPTFSSATLGSNGTTLTLNYNEVLRSTTAPVSAYTVLVDGNPVTVNSATSTGNSSTVVLTLATAVHNAQVVTVAYNAPTPDPTINNAAIQDAAGNDAVSFSARPVTNSSSIDITPPTMTSAVVTASGTQLVVNFSEILASNKPPLATFTVLVNGQPMAISGMNVSNPSNSFTLNLSGTPITSNQTVTISYAAPTPDSTPWNAAVQDATGNDTASFDELLTTNNSTVAPDLRAPVFTSAAVNSAGTWITMTYDEELIATTAPASAYTVLVDGVPFVVSSTVVSGTTVRLNMGSTIEFGKSVSVAYTAPTPDSSAANAANQDAAGNDVVTLSATAVSNLSVAGPDTIRPTLTSIVGSGNTVTLSFNETLGSATAPASAYNVFVGMESATVTNAVVSGSTVVLTLASSIPSGAVVAVDYVAPASNTGTGNLAIQDFVGNDALPFSGSNQSTNSVWSWENPPSNNNACAGSRYSNSTRARTLPNGVSYSVGVTGDFLCIWEVTESLSQRGGRDEHFTATGLITDPGVRLSSMEPFTSAGDEGCTLYTEGSTLSKCLNRGFVTMTFSEPTINPVISFAGWGGNDGGARSWSELDLVTPNVTVTRLSGTNMQVLNGTHVGIVEPNPGTRCVHAPAAGCGSLQINGTVTEVKFAVSYWANGSGWGNEDQWNIVASVTEDFGRLPSSYDVPVASHVVGFLTLGSSVNADNLTSLYGNANGNAVNPGATIPSHPGNGVTSFRDLSSADVGTTYSIPLTLAGVEASAYLCGWIDFNRDGVMSFSERTCAPNPGVNATSATLNWTVPDTLVPGPTYARIRLSYDPIPLPTGKVSSGEVEDYSLTISASALPDAVDDTSTNGQDVNQIISPLTNDQFEDGSPALNSSLQLCGYGTGPFVCNKLSLTVPGEGVYTVNSDGTVTFDPFPSFVGTATSVQYQISDTQSRTTTATITPTVTPAPSATPDTTSDFVNIVQSKSVLTNDTAGYGILSASSLFLCGTNQTTPNCSALTVSVEGGVYSVNQSTGVVTFTPSTDWAGVAPAVTYQVSNGSQQVTSSTYTPTVISQPDAEDDTSSGAYDTNQIIDVLFNDVERGADFDETTVRLCDIDDPATPGNETQTPPNCDKTSLSIPGEGTYSVNEDGTVTFNPLPTFVRTVSTPVRYQVADELGEIADALITPTVALPPLPTALPEAISDAYDTNQVYTPISNDTPGASSFPLLATTVLLCGAGETAPNCTLTTLTVDGQGTYTVNTTTGEVTFNPLPTFTGPATPISYQAKDSLNRAATSTISPTVGLPPVPTASPEAISDAYDTNQTYTPISNDTPGAASFPLLASTVLLCGPGQSAPNCTLTSLTVDGQGIYTVNPTTGEVTFDPFPTFTGPATPVSYQAKDSLNRAATSTISPTVGLPPVPTASPEAISDAYDTNQTYTPISNDTPGAASFPLLATTVLLCDTNQTAPNCTLTSLTVDGQGTYTVNPTTGAVVFDPLPTFTGPATPISYQAKDSLNRAVTSAISPTVGLPPVPTATPEAITDAYDTDQVYTPISNDTPGAASFPLLPGSVLLCDAGQSAPNCTLTSLTVDGQGTYTVNTTTGEVTFDPLPGFTGPATPISYQASDSLGRTTTSTITPTVDPPDAPVATPETQSVLPGGTATFTTVIGSGGLGTGEDLRSGSVNGPCLVDPSTNLCGTTVTIDGEGTWTINRTTGVATFVAENSIAPGDQTPVFYRITDVTGQTATSTLTPTVPPPPNAVNDTSSGDYDTDQLINPLTNDVPGDQSAPLVPSTLKLCGKNPVQVPDDCDQISVTVSGEGTYTWDPATGRVTFDPLSTFTGVAQNPVMYQIEDTLGQVDFATITPTVTAPPLIAVDDTSSGAYDTNQTISPLVNDTPGAEWDPTSVFLCGPGQTAPACDKTTLTVAGQGTYTVNPTTGEVTFDPESTFTGPATPIAYQVTDILGRTATADIAVTVGVPPVPTASPEAISDAYDTNQTYTPISNDTPGAESFPLLANTVLLCGPGQTAPACDKTTLTVTGQGIYTVNPTTGAVMFDPLPTFTGPATPISYQAKDSLNRAVTSTISPTVGLPPVPTASPEAITDAYDTNQIYTPISNDTPGAASFPLLATTVLLCGVGQSAPACDKTTLTVSNQGTYEVDSTTGEVTFDPLPTFTGTATPMSYQVSDSLGRAATSTITPTVTAPPITAVDDASSGAYNTNQTISPLVNDTPGAQWVPTSVRLCDTNETAPNCTLTSLTVDGEGTYTVNTDGTVTFDPESTFTGPATPIAYQATDILNRTATADIAVTVGVPPVPTASPEAISDAYDTNQTYTPISNDTPGAASFPLLATTVLLCGPGQTAPACDKTTLTVTGQGTYEVDPTTGAVTFDPLPTFTGPATPISYQAKDSLNRAVTSTISPTVGVPPVPTASPEAISDAYDTNQIYTPISNDTPGAVSFPLLATTVLLCDTGQTAPNCTRTSLTVDGQGTYTVNPTTGEVTFDPELTFTGPATPISYQAKDSLNRSVTSTISPTVGLPPVPTASPEAITDAYDTNQIYIPISNDTPGAASFPLLATTVLLCGTGQTAPACDKTTLTVTGQGTYTVNPTTGAVVFDPLPTFTGTATPMPYQVSDSLGRAATSTITPTVTAPPITAVDDASSGAYDTNQTISPLVNDTPGAQWVPTSVRLCDANETAPNCTLTSLTVDDEGTYTVNTDGTVTFDPLPIFTGTATSVSYQATDILNRTATADITVTVGVPPIPSASPEAISDAYDTNQVYTPISNDTPGAVTFPLLATTVLLCGSGQTAPGCDKTTLVVDGQGTYTVNPTTGAVTFDPLPTFTGPATPISYQAKDSLNRAVTSTISPTVGVPPIPSASPEAISDVYDTNQVYTPISNDTPGAVSFPLLATTVLLCDTGQTAPNCTLTSLTVPNQGTYTVNTTTGEVVFDPLPTFTGAATPISYQSKDSLNRAATSTISPTVGLPPVPTASPEAITDAYDTNQTYTPLSNDAPGVASFPLLPSSVLLCATTETAPNCTLTSLTTPNQGTYTVNPTTGAVVFDPLPTFTGTATPVSYQAKDSLNRSVTSTITPTVTAPPITAVDDVSRNAFDTNQVISPLTNDIPSAPWNPASVRLCDTGETAPNCTLTSLTVPNEGTYTVNSNGTVTFDPEATYTGTATPVVYQATDILGRTATAQITPTVDPPARPAASPETRLLLPGATSVFTRVVGMSALATGAGLQTGATSGPCLMDPSNNSCVDTVTIQDEGTWTIDQTTGVASFAALPTIAVGTHTPVVYRVTDVLGQTATSTLTPIIPPPPSAKDDAITTDYDVTQTYTPFANDTFSSIAPVVTSTLRLCASLSDASTCTATTLVVPNEGTFAVNANGTVTFDPLPTFEGTATPVRYQASDIVGQTVSATLNPIILAPPLPSANIDTASARENRTITFTPWLNDSPGPVSASGGETLAFVPTSLRLCPLGTVSKTGVVVVPTAIPACTLTKLTTKDGTYTVDIKTGKVSFVHRKRFVGTAVEPVMYQLGNTWKGPFGPAFTTSLLIPTIVPSRVPAASVGDWVWRDVKGDGLQNRKDWGISGVLVTLRTIDGREVTDLFGNTVKPQRTDKKGKYRFDDLPEGQYVVSVRYPKGLYPTTADRPGRSRNSSTTRATSNYLKLGQHDGNLDFGMVGRKPSLPTTK